jgi:hypothetical protein
VPIALPTRGRRKGAGCPRPCSSGLVPEGEGWYVLNAREAKWLHVDGLGSLLRLRGRGPLSRSRHQPERDARRYLTTYRVRPEAVSRRSIQTLGMTRSNAVVAVGVLADQLKVLLDVDHRTE